MSRREVFDVIKGVRGKGFAQAEVVLVDQLLAQLGIPPDGAATEPAWTAIARSHLGLKEIPGPTHNNRLLALLNTAQRWNGLRWSDDEMPWCGGFLSACFVAAGIDPPKIAARAASWRDWGVACKAAVGAVGVKARAGGNHVFLIVGETADKRYFKALGGNQGNRVSIIDILKADVDAIRWPAGMSMTAGALPVMARGTIGASEA